MAETKKIIRQSLADLASLANQQSGVRSSADSDLGFKMWGGKDDSGNVVYFLAKDKPGQMTTLKLTDASIATGSNGVVWHDADGDLAGDGVINYLSDVNITAVSDNDILRYDSGTSKWINESLAAPLTYKGTWNANTNTPTLGSSGTGGVQNDYYIVSVAGTTTIDGESDWQVGDWIVHNGSTWSKIDNTQVSSTLQQSYDAGTGTINLDASGDFIINLDNTTSDEFKVASSAGGADHLVLQSKGADDLGIVATVSTFEIAASGAITLDGSNQTFTISGFNLDLDTTQDVDIDAGTSIAIDATTTIEWSGTNAALTSAGVLSLLGTSSSFSLEAHTATSGDVAYIKSTPGSSSTARIMVLHADGANWGGGAHVLEIISDNANCRPFTVNNGSSDTLWINQDGKINTSGNISLISGGSIISTANGNIDLIPNGTGITTTGGGNGSQGLNTSGSLFVSDELEVDGTTYLDSAVYIGSTFTNNVAGANNWALLNVNDDGLHLALNDADTKINNNFIIVEYTNRNNNYGHNPTSANPTFFIHSNTGSGSATDQWGSFAHDQTDFVLDWGTGLLDFAGATMGGATVTHDDYVEFQVNGVTKKFMTGS